MTTAPGESASARQRTKALAEIERLTQELQADDTKAVDVLLQRAQLLTDLGDEPGARDDISRAASLVKEPKYSTPEGIAAVEKAFRELSIARPPASGSSAGSKYLKWTDKEIVDLVARSIAEDTRADCDGVPDAIRALGLRAARNGYTLDSANLLDLLDAFHTSCQQSKVPNAAKIASPLGDCLKSALVQLAAPKAVQTDEDEAPKSARGSESAKELLIDVAKHTAAAWDSHDGDGAFKQSACRHGAGMYAAAVYSLSTHIAEHTLGGEETEAGQILSQAFAFFIEQVWLVGSLPVATPDEFRSVGQGVLRLLAADKPLFIYLFVSQSAARGKSANSGAGSPLERLLSMLGDSAEAVGDKRSLAMLIASQLISSAKDPSNSSRFPGYSANTTAARSGAPPIAITQMRTLATRILDSWVQSDMQAERSRGLLAIASLFGAGVGPDLTADLWLKSGWVEDLWDQGEFDKQETQLALLRLADECSADIKVGAQMKSFGNGLVQALVRKGASKKATAMDARLADAAAIVLSKWSGAPAIPGAGRGQAEEAQSGIEEIPSEPPQEDMDPVQLADIHIRRILECTGKDASEEVAPAAEKAAEALGYLCLKPRLKEHVSQNGELLRSLFSFAQKHASASLKFSTAMLIRNLTQHRPVLSEEQKRMQQLQRLSKRAQQKNTASSADGNKPRTVGEDMKQAEAVEDGEDEESRRLDSAECVSQRASLVCKAGCISVLVSAVQPKQHPSDSIKDTVAEIMVSLATAQSLRGMVVQQGGVRALLSILTSDAPKAGGSSAESHLPQALRQQRDKNAAFALAKIAISVPPHLAFSDPRVVVRLLLSLLAEESETQALLMKFEALLALTNLASSEPGSAHDVRAYMANDLNGIGLIEMVVLSDHPMIRRAATELVCNLVYDSSVFERYVRNADKNVPSVDDEDTPAEILPSGIVEVSDDDGADEGKSVDAYRSHRLHLLVALSDVEDAETRSAASGALAILTNDLRCCRYLFLVHPRAPDVLVGLVEDSSVSAQMQTALKHRVAVIWANAANCGDARVAARIARQTKAVEQLQSMSRDPALPYYAAAKRALELVGTVRK